MFDAFGVERPDMVAKGLPSALRAMKIAGPPAGMHPAVGARIAAHNSGKGAGYWKSIASGQMGRSGDNFAAAKKTLNPIKRRSLNRAAVAQSEGASMAAGHMSAARTAGRTARDASRGTFGG